MPETLAERIAEKHAECSGSVAMLAAIQDFAREAVRQIRAEANSIEEAILILKVAAGGEG